MRRFIVIASPRTSLEPLHMRISQPALKQQIIFFAFVLWPKQTGTVAINVIPHAVYSDTVCLPGKPDAVVERNLHVAIDTERARPRIACDPVVDAILTSPACHHHGMSAAGPVGLR